MRRSGVGEVRARSERARAERACLMRRESVGLLFRARARENERESLPNDGVLTDDVRRAVERRALRGDVVGLVEHDRGAARGRAEARGRLRVVAAARRRGEGESVRREGSSTRGEGGRGRRERACPRPRGRRRAGGRGAPRGARRAAHPLDQGEYRACRHDRSPRADGLRHLRIRRRQGLEGTISKPA